MWSVYVSGCRGEKARAVGLNRGEQMDRLIEAAAWVNALEEGISSRMVMDEPHLFEGRLTALEAAPRQCSCPAVKDRPGQFVVTSSAQPALRIVRSNCAG